MEEKKHRSKKNRRNDTKRRKHDFPNFKGPERRSELDRRSGIDRRIKDENAESSTSRTINPTEE